MSATNGRQGSTRPFESKAMNLTSHAATRTQQRRIPHLLIDLLLQFGTRERAPGQANYVFFDKPSKRRVSAYAGPLIRSMEEHLNVYAIVDCDDRVITTGYRQTRVTRH